ncbi:hypothetical protein HG535_0C04990 [Zygotorulaspora mrakii]|uniref:3-ketodihydrosphingosine reductase TSC10 n=1 Tax=Zygotorulaspora mrakii TaxID=42260 RepID=A0A7H9B0C9_ZYGMR|nr:uncharacterized protein HG535_0C04990 [Zygotorulaspora mrakii]QLG72145.1 hypothetical protein HG535_0C04990 [Zygotorulaspora mrakii]
MKYTLEDQVVLITGGSQGLGKQFAVKYYNESVRTKIIIVSRSVAKLKNAVTDITKGDKASPLNSDTDVFGSDQRVYYMSCDMSEHESVAGLFDTLFAVKLLPTQVLACAGGSTPKLFKDLTGSEIEMGIRMNYMSTVFLANKVAQLLPHSHLILFSSETAFFPFIGYGQYAPLKVSIKALTSILRQELSEGRVSCVFPSNFASEGFTVEELTKPSITKQIEGPSETISCEECCDKIVWWLSKGYDDVSIGFLGWVLMSTDMGLNKHHNYSFLWFLQILFGTLTNLLIVPLFMMKCTYDIKKWYKEQHNKQHKI